MSHRRKEGSTYDYGFASHWGGDHAADRQHYDGQLYIERVRLDRGGYTKEGTYFGVGQPLFQVFNSGVGREHVFFFVRADDRVSAKRLVKTGYPKAKLSR